MVSKTKINARMKKKKYDHIVDTILNAKRSPGWLKIAQIVSSSRRKYSSLNLGEIDKRTKEGDTVVVPGKVLGSGKVTKKIRICALGFSDSAREKLKETKSEIVTILAEIKKNPKAQGVKIIR